MKEPSTPQQVSQCSTGDINIIKQSGWPITTTPSERKRVNRQKPAFIWQITGSAKDQGKKDKLLTKLVLVQYNLFSLSMIKVPLGNKHQS